MFKGNYGYDGSIFLEGQFNISCHNSTFSSNSADNVGGAISLKLDDSILKVSNTAFLNNSCRNSGGGAIGIRYIGNTKIIITGSIFVSFPAGTKRYCIWFRAISQESDVRDQSYPILCQYSC